MLKYLEIRNRWFILHMNLNNNNNAKTINNISGTYLTGGYTKQTLGMEVKSQR